MIFIVCRYKIKPELVDGFPERLVEGTNAVRSEPGNLFFEWSQSLDDPTEFFCIEGFKDAEAGREHVNADHSKKSDEWFPYVISEKPEVVYVEVPGDKWSPMVEIDPA